MTNRIKNFFGVKSPAEQELDTAMNAVKEAMEAMTGEDVKKEPEKAAEEWVWTEGYKGMNKNMQCRNEFQYEIGKRYDMPEDANIEVCSSGFHFCLKMSDVDGYVTIGDNNRFFKVRALVRKKDLDNYGRWNGTFGGLSFKNGNLVSNNTIDKLSAKSIEIVRELTMDEILDHTEARNWETTYKELAITVGIDNAKRIIHRDELVGYGYSLPFAQWLANNKKYEIAKAVGSQADLSMDMKCLMIMNG